MPSPRRFENKSILVTGASSGIGRATALALGREGASLIAAGRRRDRLEEVARKIRDAGGRCEVATGDVRDESIGAGWVAEAKARHGGLDGLVNAAGVIGNTGLLETTPEEWDRVMDSNLRSIFLVMRAAAPALIERKGSMVSLSSVAGPRPYMGVLPYCVSKAGVDQLTRCVALEMAPHGVRVNAVCPGVVVTELHTVTRAIADYPAFLERSKTTHPLGRVGQPEEVASLILFLLSAEAGWITGGTYSIDGGRALASAR
jgi:NAD(P)-dependent dehydrogenase (short-subunit alcohol dehydrogenase family)